ncbi:MAG TPA: hypothetical protein VFA99_14555 [Acidobacteriaceae bacterium]|nr:hypothetical protein [Acidobacteriaceae bacterium]
MAEKTLQSEAKTGSTVKDAGGSTEVKPLPKETKLNKRDWQKIETHLKDELDQRKQSPFRTSAEGRWREVDRQVSMNPMVKVNADGAEVSLGWHNVVELGELSRASENTSADVRRIIFPQTRFWFEAHADISSALGLDKNTGEKNQQPKLQERVNGRVRSFMAQQHDDFGLKDRVELSIKEALHHGSFVAEIELDEQEFVHDAVKVSKKRAPVWKPHSMWNCYPDLSPSVIGTNIFYEGSMFVESFAPRHRAERMVKDGGEGWMPSQWRKVSKDAHKGKDNQQVKDVKITTYWGDIFIDRADETLYYPNHKAVLMNGTIVYMAPNKTPYPPIIYRCYERMDVRDPYGMSPIIKMSPMQKLGTMMANKGMDGVELSLEPPIVYDGNDPDFVLNGGPVIEPGAKVSTKGSNAFSQVQIGNPQVAFDALQFILGEMKEKLGRPGRPVGDRATKAEVVKAAQDQEAALVDFIDKMEHSMRSFLFMQHALNLSEVDRYSYYSPEMEDPDFLVMTKKDLPKAVHFSVVGARGVLGEEERNQKMSVVTAFAAGNPLFAPLLDTKALLGQMFQDAGVKNPERFIVQGPNAGQLQVENQQLKQAVQKIGGLLQEEKNKTGVKMAKVKADAIARDQKQRAEHAARIEKQRMEHEDRMVKLQAEIMAKMAEIRADHIAEVRKLFSNYVLEQQKMFVQHMSGGGAAGGKEGEKTKGADPQTLKDMAAALAKLAGPRKRTVKGKKVNGEWSAEVTEH